MRLQDFLNSATNSAPVKHIKIKVQGEGTNKSGKVSGTVDATLVFVSETERAEAIRDAHKVVREGNLAEVTLENEIAFQVLHRALRDSTSDNYIVPFAESVKGLKNALVLVEAQRVYNEYSNFMEEEYPPSVDSKQFEELVKEAEGKSLAALLSEYGSSAIRQALPSLAVRFGK